jgi:hypothetical protein
MRSPAELKVVSESIRVRIPSPPLVPIPAKIVNMEGIFPVSVILTEE